jgi:hypothetical protein
MQSYKKGGNIIDDLEFFQKNLSEIINSCKLPLSVIKICLQNYLYELEIIKLNTLLNPKETENKLEEENKTE